MIPLPKRDATIAAAGFQFVQYVLAFAALLLVLTDTLTTENLRTPIRLLGGMLIVLLPVTEILTWKQLENDQTV